MSTTPPVLHHEDDPERHLPAHHNPLPELTDEQPVHLDPAAFTAMQASPEFALLRSRHRRFAFPLTIAFLAWYFFYVLMSTYAEAFMTRPFIGNVTIGLFLGLLQFLSTFLITWLYIRHATRNLDPVAATLRTQLEGGRR